MKKRILTILISLVMMLSLILPAFAGGSYSGTTGYISDGTTTVTSSDIPVTIINQYTIQTIYVPSSVRTIESGAFTGFVNLQTVYIDSAQGEVSIATGALPSTASVVYTGTPTTTTKRTTTTQWQTTRRYNTTRRTTTTTASTTESTTTSTTTTTATQISVYETVTNYDTDTASESGNKNGTLIAGVAVGIVAISAIAMLILKFKK